MKALRIYAKGDSDYPCKAMDLQKVQNTLVLGEAASIACLELGIQENTLAIIEGVGYATEVLEHNISISADAICFQRSMKMALGTTDPEDVDVIVMHAPGTVKGDLSEKRAIDKLFSRKVPFLTTNKWKVGHTFGASGMLSLEMAILMIQNQVFIPVPYNNKKAGSKTIRRIMVNAVGFGGNAVSILLKHP
jgi:3-oxoacyl-(acyl-carrier-protein) synthase